MKYQVNDVFPNWLTTGGIFTLLAAVRGGHDIPWSMDANLLDMDYHGNHSGGKLISPLLCRLLEAGNGQIDITNLGQLAILIHDRFIDNWTKRWEALQAEYNPLENYSMQEDMENDDTTITHAKALTKSGNRTFQHGETTTRSGSVELTPEAVTTVESSVYAFDSSTETPAEKAVTTPSGSNTTTYNDLEDAKSGTDTETFNNVKDQESGTTKTEHGYSLSRSGNIGVTTSQQMLQSELEIRTYDYYLSVFEDIDKVLTIPVY